MKHSVFFQRLEAAAFLIAIIIQYFHGHGTWWMLAILLFVPDISILGYSLGNRAGAIIYNVFHSFALPVTCTTSGLVFGNHTLQLIGLIWLMHVSMDRAAGYGLKDFDGFHHTHLGPIGKAKHTKKSA